MNEKEKIIEPHEKEEKKKKRKKKSFGISINGQIYVPVGKDRFDIKNVIQLKISQGSDCVGLEAPVSDLLAQHKFVAPPFYNKNQEYLPEIIKWSKEIEDFVNGRKLFFNRNSITLQFYKKFKDYTETMNNIDTFIELVKFALNYSMELSYDMIAYNRNCLDMLRDGNLYQISIGDFFDFNAIYANAPLVAVISPSMLKLKDGVSCNKRIYGILIKCPKICGNDTIFIEHTKESYDFLQRSQSLYRTIVRYGKKLETGKFFLEKTDIGMIILDKPIALRMITNYDL